jgi:hypothetical protein
MELQLFRLLNMALTAMSVPPLMGVNIDRLTSNAVSKPVTLLGNVLVNHTLKGANVSFSFYRVSEQVTMAVKRILI